MNTDVFAEISDPWDLGETLGWPVLTGRLEEFKNFDNETIFIVKLDKSIKYKNEEYLHFIVSNRYEGEKVTDIFSTDTVTCGFGSIAFQPEKIGSLVYDRRLGIIGTLSLTNQRLRK